MLPRRKGKETLSDYRCSVAANEREGKETLSDYSCSVGSKKKKETGDGLATISAVLAQRRGNSLAATVAVLAPEEETERRRLSDYSCSVGVRRRNGKMTTTPLLWCWARKRKMATVGALAQKEMGDKVRKSGLTYLSRVD